VKLAHPSNPFAGFALFFVLVAAPLGEVVVDVINMVQKVGFQITNGRVDSIPYFQKQMIR
jgi:hypothetical protein